MNLISKFTKKDFYFSIVTGCITGFAVWRIFEYLRIEKIGTFYGLGERFPETGLSWAWLMVVVPVLWILGVSLGYFLGKWFGFFNQFGKFSAIGFTNAAVDFGVLNLLIANTGVSGGGWYSIFKAISFVCAIIPSYFWNKYWAFESAEGGSGFQFAKFMSVAIFAIFINTGTASFIVNYIHPLWGLNSLVWANVGAIIGSAVALTFSFVGFKVAVFKK